MAKIASDMHKPNGLTFIGPSRVEAFVEKLPVEKFFGVGKVTAEKMKKMNLHTGADLKMLSENDLIKSFGKPGRFYYKIVRGQDDRPVQPDRETKSVGAEDNFPYDLTDFEEMVIQLKKIVVLVVNRLQKNQLKGRTVTLKIKYHDFKQITRSKSFDTALDDEATIVETAIELLKGTDTDKVKVRLLGISLSNFGEIQPKFKENKEPEQLDLFVAE